MIDIARQFLRKKVRQSASEALGVGARRFGMLASKLLAFDVSDFRALPLTGDSVEVTGSFMVGWSAIGGDDPVA